MMSRLLAGTLAAAFAIAPMQCAHKPEPDLRREDSPDDALWGLAESFRAKGDDASRRETLRYLVEKYPTSRHAEDARAELARGGGGSGVEAGAGR